MIATIYELWNDRNGDLNKSTDVVFRIVFLAVEAAALALIFDKNYHLSLLLSCSVFFLTFDYAINIILYKRGVIDYANWFSYTGKSGVVDTISFWKNMNPWVKFGIRLTVFIVALIVWIN